jgi:hypothetical protein
MEVIRLRLLKRFGSHPLRDQIVTDLTAILARAEAAWEDMDRNAFSKACKELKRYQPPSDG